MLGLNHGKGKGFFFPPNHVDWPWGPPSFLFSGYHGSFPGVKWLAMMWPLSPTSVKFKNEWSYTATPPFAFMAWTETTASLFQLLIYIKRLNETFCNFMHMTAILLHHRCTAWWNIWVFPSWAYSGFLHTTWTCQIFIIIRLTHNISLFLIPDMFSFNSFSIAHVTYW